VQMNIVSLGMFFSILGGFLLHFGGYTLLYTVTSLVILTALIISFRLRDSAP